MRDFAASSTIRAKPEAIWAVLADGSRWTEWDSAVVRVDGTIAPGAKVTVYPEVNPGRRSPTCSRLSVVSPTA